MIRLDVVTVYNGQKVLSVRNSQHDTKSLELSQLAFCYYLDFDIYQYASVVVGMYVFCTFHLFFTC